MAIIKRNRTLRPSSREPQSTYKIDTSKVEIDDTLYVTITHEDNAEFNHLLFVSKHNSVWIQLEYTDSVSGESGMGLALGQKFKISLFSLCLSLILCLS